MTIPRAELILYNGTIRTLDPQQPDVEAVAVANGRITMAGSLEQAETTAHANTRRIDLAGRTLLPGFYGAIVQFNNLLSVNQQHNPSNESAIMQIARQCTQIGITSISVAAAPPDLLDDFRILAAERRLPLRINAIAMRYTPDGIKLPLPQRFESNWLRIDTVWLSTGTDGHLNVSDEKMRAMVWDIHRAGLRAMIFASTTTIEQTISAIEYASGRLASRLRHCIASIDQLSDEQIRRCREHRINILVQPQNYNSRLSDLIKSGIIVGLSFGSLQQNPSALAFVKPVITSVGVADALALYTIGSATVAGEDQLKGTISADKYADFVILSGDPFRAPMERITDLQAEMTIMNGQIVYNA